MRLAACRGEGIKFLFFCIALDNISFLLYPIIVTGIEIVKRLKELGWKLVRIKGSHHLMGKNGKTIPVPVHGSKTIGRDLFAEIQRQAGEKLK